MGISRSHASWTKLQDDLTNLTRITLPVFIKVGNEGYMNPVGTISASSSREAFSEVANLLRVIADEIDPSVDTVVQEDTETQSDLKRYLAGGPLIVTPRGFEVRGPRPEPEPEQSEFGRGGT